MNISEAGQLISIPEPPPLRFPIAFYWKSMTTWAIFQNQLLMSCFSPKLLGDWVLPLPNYGRQGLPFLPITPHLPAQHRLPKSLTRLSGQFSGVAKRKAPCVFTWKIGTLIFLNSLNG